MMNELWRYWRLLTVALVIFFGCLGTSMLNAAKPPMPAPSRLKQSSVPLEQTNIMSMAKPDYILPPVEAGRAPVVDRIPTQQKVVFLTIDDGLYRIPEIPQTFKRYHMRLPMFLNNSYVSQDPGYFQRLQAIGLTAENHTINHPDLTTLTYIQQVTEICGDANGLHDGLGKRPVLFRPPYGSYNDSVLQAAALCGMRAVVMWSAKVNGGSMQYQDGHTGLLPGDIVLMHFRPEFNQDFAAFMIAARKAGLQPASLEDWLVP